MPHAWILDVLTDLRTYAEANNLPTIADAAAQALEVAKVELASEKTANFERLQD
jgi:hypothetical protein